MLTGGRNMLRLKTNDTGRFTKALKYLFRNNIFSAKLFGLATNVLTQCHEGSDIKALG